MKKGTKKMLKSIKKMITTFCIVFCIFIKSVDVEVIWTNESKTFKVEATFYELEEKPIEIVK